MKVLLESSLNRLLHHMGKDKEFAILSASRAKDAVGNPISDRENKRRSHVMGKAIRGLGYSFIKVHGRVSELQHDGSQVHVRERSFLVPGMTKKHAIRLGRIWGQDSVIHSSQGKDRIDFKTTRETPEHKKLGKTQFSLHKIVAAPSVYDTAVARGSGWNKPRGKKPKPGKLNAQPARAFHFESSKPRTFALVVFE